MGIKNKLLLKLSALGLGGVIASFQSAGAVPKPLSMQNRTGVEVLLGANRTPEAIAQVISQEGSREGVTAKDLASSVARLNLPPEALAAAARAIASSEGITTEEASKVLIQETYFERGLDAANAVVETVNTFLDVDVNVNDDFSGDFGNNLGFLGTNS